MPRNVRTARGEVINFDALIIKQKLSEAPMNIEVARRKKFIDSKEGTARGERRPKIHTVPDGKIDHDLFVTNEPVRQTGSIAGPDSIKKEAAPAKKTSSVDFEPEGGDQVVKSTTPVEPVPILPERKK